MINKRLDKIFSILLASLLGFNSVFMVDALACSRVLYAGKNNIVMTGRTTDWYDDVNSNLWIFPRGVARSGLTGASSLQWTAKYGSVVTTVHDTLPIDGMNEKGLVMNLLYLKESEFIKANAKDSRKTMAVSLWGQYMLDNFATVAEAVKDAQSNRFYVLVARDPSGGAANLHLSLSDASGDSAIFEYMQGKLNIYHGKQYKVLTNSPELPQQLAIREYWKRVDGTKFVPGGNNAADRFTRLSFYSDTVPATADNGMALATVLSMIRSISVPVGIKTPDEPNVASTSWRTVADQKRKVYYFDSVYERNLIWVDFGRVNFAKEQPIRKLELNHKPYYNGEVSQDFKAVKSFNFYAPK